jgi:hypothetical protein
MLLKWLLGEWNSLRLPWAEAATEPARIEKAAVIRARVRKQLAEERDTQIRHCLSDLLAKVARWEIRSSFPPLELLNDLEAMLPATAANCVSIAMIATRADRFSLLAEPDSLPGQIRRLSLDSLRIATWLGLIVALLVWLILSTSLALTLLEFSGLPYRVMWAGVAGAIVSVAIKTGALVEDPAIDPFDAFISTVLRPAIGAAFALLLFSMVRLNVVNLGISMSPPSGYACWFIGFLAGFSERLVPDLILRAESMSSSRRGENRAEQVGSQSSIQDRVERVERPHHQRS